MSEGEDGGREHERCSAMEDGRRDEEGHLVDVHHRRQRREKGGGIMGGWIDPPECEDLRESIDEDETKGEVN